MMIRNRTLLGVITAVLLLSATGAAQAQMAVGTVDAVDHERERLVIDGIEYVLAPAVVPERADNPDFIVPLRIMRPGVAVQFEVADTDGEVPRIDSIQVLTD